MRNSASRVTAILVLVFLVLPSASVGACSAWMGVSMASQPHGGEGLWVISLAIGVVALLAVVGFSILVRNLWKG